MYHCPNGGAGELKIIEAILEAGDREDPHPPGARSIAATPGRAREAGQD
jgi:hypothetical protein